MKRRDFIAALGGAAAWPLAARAQQPAMPVIGFLGSSTSGALRQQLAALRVGLKEAGYVEGQNVEIEYRFAEGQFDRIPAIVSDMLRRSPAVLTMSSAGRFAPNLEPSTIAS